MTIETTAPTPTPAPTPAPTTAPEPTPSPSKPWYETRIDGLTREKYEQADRIAKLEKDLEDYKKSQTAAPTPTAAPAVDPNKKPINMTQEEFNAAVKKQADEQKAVDNFNIACNNVYNAGKTAFEDFETSIQTFQKLGGIPIPVVEIALDMDAPEALLYNLSKNLDKAAEIFKLSPAKQAIALTKFQAEVAKAEKDAAKDAKNNSSPAFKPVVGGTRSTTEPDPEKMNMEEFIAWREKQGA